MQEDVKASHVMIYVEDFNNAGDTANAWNEIRDAYEQVRSGRMTFEEAAHVLAMTVIRPRIKARSGGSTSLEWSMNLKVWSMDSI